MKIFAEERLSDLFEETRQKVEQQVRAERDDYLLNVGEEAYVAHLIERFRLDPLNIQFEDQYVSQTEKMVPAEYFPGTYNVYRGKSYPKQVVTFHLPFTGTARLLRCQPNRRILWTEEVQVSQDEIQFDVIAFSGDAEPVKRTAEQKVRSIKQQFGNLQREVADFNSDLETFARDLFRSRRAELLKRSDLLAALEMPVKKRTDGPRTFSVPTPRTPKPVVKKPEVHETGFKPHPTVGEEVYEEILEICEDLGTTMERLPATYAEKSEEDLRDHFLLYLAPRFSGAATGETFNKSGKTDILIRYENTNVFVAECKIWRGAKVLHSAIDQLLSYLTWRDSKTALILFVPNKDFSRVTATVREEVPEHPNYLGTTSDHSEGRVRYLFSLPGDENREIHLTVLLFHLPR